MREGLKKALEGLLEGYDFRGRAAHDPIMFPMRYRARADIEAAGFVASSFAYGRVGLFSGVIERVLSQMGKSPSGFLREFNPRRHRGLFSGISYRFNTNKDIMAFLHITGTLLRRYGGLESAFTSFLGRGDTDTGAMLSGFTASALDIDTGPVYGEDLKPRGLRQFFPSPASGGACKRACLFLRWMVRKGDIDFGIWRSISPSVLVIPLDTHIARVSRCLGLTARKTGGWKTALEVTRALRELDPKDPLRYDFALCHMGISGACGPGECRGCVLGAFSRKGR